MDKLKHVKPLKEHEKDAINYIREFYKYNSDINGAGGLKRYLNDYDNWLKKLENDRNQIPDEKNVPAETYFLVRESDNKIVGMINIRLVLNERLRKEGGHIGYGIRPTERRKGYNKLNLYLGLKCLKEHGVKEAFLDCNKDNLGSAKTIKALGGKLTKEYYNLDLKCMVQDYLIDVDKSIKDNAKIYEPMIGKEI